MRVGVCSHTIGLEYRPADGGQLSAHSAVAPAGVGIPPIRRRKRGRPGYAYHRIALPARPGRRNRRAPGPARRRRSTGRVVGLLDNSKSGTRPFLDRVEELLQREHGVARIVRYDKQAAALPAPDEILDAASRECDVVINGIAD